MTTDSPKQSSGGAIISACGQYRYWLQRHLPDGGRLIVVNLFGFRSTDPAALLKCSDPVGPGNDAAVMLAVRAHLDTGATVLDMLNGSTADAENNDPTLRRGMYFAQHQAKGKWVCAWGRHKAAERRSWTMKRMLREAGVTLHRFVPPKGGAYPPHPLYLPNDCPIEVWNG